MQKKLITFLTSAILVFIFANSVSAAVTEINFSDEEEKVLGYENYNIGLAGLVYAGDVNNDGYGDYVFSGRYNNLGSITDIAYLVYGREDWNITNIYNTEIASFYGISGDGYGGPLLSGGGDINGDGYDDILVGMSFENTRAGATYIIYGSATKYSSFNFLTDVPKFTGENAGDYSGASVSLAGDINQDGYDDFLIGAHWNDSKKGAAYLVYGQAEKFTGATGLSTVAKFTGLNNDDLTGEETAGLGDVNNDGYVDFAIGAYAYNDYTGRAYIVYGQADEFTGTHSLTEADIIFNGEETYDGAGAHLGEIGDINGDNYDDILIGSQEEGSGSIDDGCYLIYGGALSGENNLASADAKFYSSLANSGDGLHDAYYLPVYLGDVNHDGYDDLGISVPYYDTTDGAVFLLLGQAEQIFGNLSLSDTGYVFTITDTDQMFGSQADSGDINGDGFNDLLVSLPNEDTNGLASGAVYVGQLYTDADSDGVPGTGLLPGTDTDDSVKDIASVTGKKNGYIKIIYVNDEFTRIKIYNISAKRKTKVAQYDGAYYLVLHPRAKKIRLFDTTALSTESTLTLSKTTKYNKHYLKVKDFRHDNSLDIIEVSSLNSLTMINLILVNSLTGRLIKKASEQIINLNIKPSKTKIKGNRVILKNKHGRKMMEYYVSRNYNLKVR